MRPLFETPRQAAQRRISKPLYVQMLKKVRLLVPMLEREITSTTDKFFRTGVQYLDKQASLAEQVAVPGLHPWEPLDLAYIKWKASANFFALTGHGAWPGLSFGGASLIDTLHNVSGTNAFGKAYVEVQGWNGLPLTTRAASFPSSPTQCRLRVILHPWGRMTRLDVFHIEHWLEYRGIISRETRIKLTNPNGPNRPFLRPLMVYYSDVILPAVVQRILCERFAGLNVTVKVERPFVAGGF